MWRLLTLFFGLRDVFRGSLGWATLDFFWFFRSRKK